MTPLLGWYQPSKTTAGRQLQTLRELDLAKHTLVIATTDPGIAIPTGHVQRVYDLVQDPWEPINLVDKPMRAAVRNERAGRLYQHMVETDDPLLRGAATPPQHETTLKLLQGKPAASKGMR